MLLCHSEPDSMRKVSNNLLDLRQEGNSLRKFHEKTGEDKALRHPEEHPIVVLLALYIDIQQVSDQDSLF